MQTTEIAFWIIIGVTGARILKELFYICILICGHCCRRRDETDVELGIHPSWKHKKASDLKDHLDAWLKETGLPAGIDSDDHSLFILMPEERKNPLEKSLKKKIKDFQDSDIGDCYKIITHQGMFIDRDQDYVGAGSSIYFKDDRGNPVRSSFGLLLEDVSDHKRYILTTTHLADKRGTLFYFSNGQLTFELGICVAHVCQACPLVEACLVELKEEVYDRLSAFLSINGTRAEYVIRGPYTGNMSALLAEPKEVLKAGGKTGLTRGRMKSADFDFNDPATGNRLYSSIVTIPTEENFADRGDSGAVICTSTCQAFTVGSWYSVNRAQNEDTYVVSSNNIQTNESVRLLHEEGALGPPETSSRETRPHVNEDVERHAQPCDHPLAGREILPGVAQAERQIISYGYHTIPPEHEVMAHEALSVHNFGYYPWDVEGTPVRASISFKLEPAIKSLEEQIHGKLVLLPLLRGFP